MCKTKGFTISLAKILDQKDALDFEISQYGNL